MTPPGRHPQGETAGPLSADAAAAATADADSAAVRLASRKARIKLVLAAVLAGIGAMAAVAAVGIGGLLLVTAERSSAAPGPENKIPASIGTLPAWTRDGAATVLHEVDQTVLDRVADGYLRAWLAVTNSLDTCRDAGLSAAFASGALEQAQADLAAARAAKCVTHRVARPSSLVLSFVSADGAVIGFVDDQLWLVDTFPGPDHRPRTLQMFQRRQVLMVLDDGNWRVHAWVPLSTTVVDAKPSTK